MSSEFTTTSLKEFMKMTGKVIIIMFDNDEHWIFMEDEETRKLTSDMFVTVGGTECIKKKNYISSKRGGKYGGISKEDIPVTEYKPISTIQGVVVLDNPDDLKFIDKGRLYVQ